LAAKNQQTTAVEEVDLYKLIRAISHSWVTLLIFIVIGGLVTGLYSFLRKLTYTATAIVSVDSSVLLSQTSPLFLFQSDAVKTEVAQNLSMSIKDLPEVIFSQDKTDKTIIYISTSSDNKDIPVKLVNSWADAAVKLINTNDENAKNEIDAVQQAVDSADSALINYLQQKGLSDLTWVDLVAITGIEDQSVSTILDTTKQYPTMTAEQKMVLTDLVRQKMLAEWNFSRVNESVLRNQVPNDLRAVILNRAYQPEETKTLTPYLMIPLGLILGFLVAVVWILIKDWWDNSIPLTDESRKSP